MNNPRSAKSRMIPADWEPLQLLGKFNWHEPRWEPTGQLLSHIEAGRLQRVRGIQPLSLSVEPSVVEIKHGMPTILVRFEGAEPNVVVEHPEFSEVSHLLDSAIDTFSVIASVKALYVRLEENWVTIVSVVDPWTADARDQVFEAELSLKRQCPRAKVYFEAVRSESIASLEVSAKLVYKK